MPIILKIVLESYDIWMLHSAMDCDLGLYLLPYLSVEIRTLVHDLTGILCTSCSAGHLVAFTEATLKREIYTLPRMRPRTYALFSPFYTGHSIVASPSILLDICLSLCETWISI